MMKKLFLGTVVFLLAAFQNVEASLSLQKNKATELNFKYSTSDGGFYLDCVSWIQDSELPDWDVICGKGTPTIKQYKVHWVQRGGNSNRMEILYWVTDRNSPKGAQFSSHTSFFEFADNTQLKKIILTQSLENDAAYLQISLDHP